MGAVSDRPYPAAPFDQKAPVALPFTRLFSFSLAACLLSLGSHAAPPTAAQAASQPDAACGCQQEEREYTAQPTPDVIALWSAATAGEEEEFMRLLPRVATVADHAVQGRPLLAAILWPPKSPSRHTYWDMPPEEAEHLLTVHRQRMPAKTRMLAAAIKQGASVHDVSFDSPRPPLHLAMVFGTPDMVKMLLAAGAPVDRRDPRERQTALEFLLKQEFFVRMTSLPPLVTRAQRSEMVMHLLAAGAERPFRYAEASAEKEGVQRPVADYLAWVPLVTLTEGGEVLRAMLKTGTRPATDPDDENEPTALAVAAATGNVGAVEVLRTLATSSDPGKTQGSKAAPWNAQLDAALAAAATGNLALARSLTEAGMPFDQRGPRALAGKQLVFKRIEVDDGTLLQFAVRSGDTAWVRQLAAWGAPLDASEDNPRAAALFDALESGHDPMVELLLELGANPLRHSSQGKAPLILAIEAGNMARVTSMLNRIQGDRRHELARMSGDIATAWSRSPELNTAQQRPALKRLLDDAGFAPRHVRAAVLASLIGGNDDTLARQLVIDGAPVNLDANDDFVESPLAQAVKARDAAMVDLLLTRGAQVRRTDREGWGPIQLALRQGDAAMVDKLLRAGATLDFPAEPNGSALELAIGSRQIGLVDTVIAASRRPPSQTCITQPATVRTLLLSEETFDALITRGLPLRTPCGAKPALLQQLYEQLTDPEGLPLLGGYRSSVLRTLAKAGSKGGDGLRLGSEGRTPLQAAIAARRYDVVGVLLESGARAGASGHGAESSPAWLAIESRQPEILRLLIARGASLADKAPSGLTLAEHLRCRESDSFRRAAAQPLPANGPCPADRPMSAQDTALAKKLVGHYYLKGVREVGSEILLRANGTFDYMLAYGAVDELAQGQWRVAKSRVVFSSAPGVAGNPFKPAGASRDEA